MGNRFEVWVNDPNEGWYHEGTYDNEHTANKISDTFEYSYVKEA